MTTTTRADGVEPLLVARNVVKNFPVRKAGLFGGTEQLQAVADVSFEVYPGETLGLVGESGCGKSTLARCVTRLYDLTSGAVEFEGRDISTLNRRQMRPLRREMQVIFQDPYGSLNPRRRVGSIIGDAFRIHEIDDARGSKRRVQELMELVGLNPEHYNRFPAEFSGGQRQRIGVARALALSPKIIVCDEPVSALDVSIQAQVLNLLGDLQKELGLTYIFISHDLSVVRHVSDRIAVMYLGKIVETADAETIFTESRHPYTRALLSALPPPDPDAAAGRERIVLSGDLPSPQDPPSGCRFHPRCPRAVDQCVTDVPITIPAFDDGPDHTAACWRPMLASDNLVDSTPQIENSIVGLDAAAFDVATDPDLEETR
ncbi:MAG: ATP-binding cassette protein [Marmoricola sp.]|nr:ATP-binding cassette protein [Marmoricola sp.]